MTRAAPFGLIAACLMTIPGLVFAQDAAPGSQTDAELTEQQEAMATANFLIIGGEPVTDPSDAPWQVALVDDGTRNQFCGGALIDETWILTAAHCVDNFFVGMDASRVDVVLGTLTYPTGGEQIGVTAIHVHPNWDDGNLDFDAALLELESAASMGETIAIHGSGETLPEDIPVLVTGWGATSEGGPGSTTLMKVEVPVVSTDICNQPESYDGAVTDAMFCAGQREGGMDACQGDSGGPVAVDLEGTDTLVGVVSWGHGCARRLKYGVYTRVGEVADWVNETAGMK